MLAHLFEFVRAEWKFLRTLGTIDFEANPNVKSNRKYISCGCLDISIPANLCSLSPGFLCFTLFREQEDQETEKRSPMPLGTVTLTAPI